MRLRKFQPRRQYQSEENLYCSPQTIPGVIVHSGLGSRKFQSINQSINQPTELDFTATKTTESLEKSVQVVINIFFFKSL